MSESLTLLLLAAASFSAAAVSASLSVGGGYVLFGATTLLYPLPVAIALQPVLSYSSLVARSLAFREATLWGIVRPFTLGSLGGVALGQGGPAIPDGGVPLPENQTFRALIGPGQMAVIARLAGERRKVAARFGVRDLPEDEAWLEIHAGALRGSGARPVPGPAAAARMLRCATVASLAPLASAARIAGIDVPGTEAMITLASTVLGAEIGPAGRRLDAIGINAGNLDEARRILDSIAGSRRNG